MFYFKKNFYYGNSFKRLFRMTMFGSLQRRVEERKDFIKGLTKNIFVGYSLIKTFRKETSFYSYISKSKKLFFLFSSLKKELLNKKLLDCDLFFVLKNSFFNKNLLKTNFFFSKYILFLFLLAYCVALSNFFLKKVKFFKKTINFFKKIFFLLKLNKDLTAFDFKNIFFNRNLTIYPPAKFEEILSGEYLFNDFKIKLFPAEFSENGFVKQSSVQFIKMPIIVDSFSIFKSFIYKAYFIFITNFFTFKKLQVLLSLFFFKYFLFSFLKNLKLKKAKMTKKKINFDIFFDKYVFNHFFYYAEFDKMLVLCLFIKKSQLSLKNFYKKASLKIKKIKSIKQFIAYFFVLL